MLGTPGHRTGTLGEACHVSEIRELPEDLLIGLSEGAVVVDAVGHLSPAAGHLAWMLDGLECLGPECVHAAIPEEPAQIGHVPQSRGMALELRDTLRQGKPVAEALLRVVAGGTGNRPGARETRVEEQKAADDNARDHAIAAARLKSAAANHAAEAIVIYDLQREAAYELGKTERTLGLK